MVQTAVCKIVNIPVFCHESIHNTDRLRLRFKWPSVEHLDTEPLLHCQQFRSGAVQLFPAGGILHSPSKVRFRHKNRQAQDGDSMKVRFPAIICAVHALLPPEAL